MARPSPRWINAVLAIGLTLGLGAVIAGYWFMAPVIVIAVIALIDSRMPRTSHRRMTNGHL